jgi:hypothetical protein
MNKKTLVIIALIALVILVATYFYVAFFAPEEPKRKELPPKEEDDRISPYTNQGITVEILRIRNRGLMDKILKFGPSWRNKPCFYWKIIVDDKECSSLGNITVNGVFNDWDTMLQEYRVNYYVKEEQEKSDVTISIFEQVKKGLFGRRIEDVEKERIRVVYNYRTGRWTGMDYLKDDDGYGHYLGETYEIWFNIYQSDYDHDKIPFWTEVNVLGTDPSVDDSMRDPDEDGIPTSWEWKWGYDPHVWDDHVNLDPDIDGIENIEEYQMRKWFGNPYQPDIYIETDGMQKRGLLDLKHVFFKESQQMIIERFARHGINVYIDDGWSDGPVNGGGELLPFIQSLDDVVGGPLRFYEHNFADERKGIFRYVIIANTLGWCIPSKYNYYDTILVSSGIRETFFKRTAFTPRHQRVVLAKGILHELGHSMGLMPTTFPGVDIMYPVGVRWPNMPEEEYERYLNDYHSIMNYNYIWRDRKLFDYSNGVNGPPYDQNDWKHIYLPAFQFDSISYEEPVDETFEDLEVVDEEPGVLLDGWVLDENLTQKYRDELKKLVFIEDIDVVVEAYIRICDNDQQPSDRNLRVYARPKIDPFPISGGWSLVGEGYVDSEGNIHFYHMQ